MLDSLDPEVVPASGSVPQVMEFMDFAGQKTPLHTETSYVPDLTQGEFQPLEDPDDEWLKKLDLEAIIAEAAHCTKQGNLSGTEVNVDCVKVMDAKNAANAISSDCSAAKIIQEVQCHTTWEQCSSIAETSSYQAESIASSMSFSTSSF